MTEELKQAAQQALEALQKTMLARGGTCAWHRDVKAAITTLERALTQRPAAQAGERDTGPRVLREVFELCEDTMTKMESESTEFSRGRAFEAKGISRAIGTWFQDEFCGRSHMGEPVIQPAAQATPEPVALGPLAKRNIYDAIRGAYDLGYNDARNARTVPGDSAPGYDGRSVEEDHGSALFNILSKRLKPATPEPVGDVPGGQPADEKTRWIIRRNGDGEFGQATGWLYRDGGHPCSVTGKPVYVWRPLSDLTWQNSSTAPIPVDVLVGMYDESPTSDGDMIAFARAVERHHGITAQGAQEGV